MRSLFGGMPCDFSNMYVLMPAALVTVALLLHCLFDVLPYRCLHYRFMGCMCIPFQPRSWTQSRHTCRDRRTQMKYKWDSKWKKQVTSTHECVHKNWNRLFGSTVNKRAINLAAVWAQKRLSRADNLLVMLSNQLIANKYFPFSLSGVISHYSSLRGGSTGCNFPINIAGLFRTVHLAPACTDS